jgi:hypothetical protein
MHLPRRYSYDPQWRLIVFVLVASAALLGLVAIQWVSFRVGIALGGALMVLALLLIVRRLALRRFVELGPDALSLPTGFLQSHTTRIPYSDITRAWEIGLPLTVVLCIATDERRFDIPSTLLPDTESYVALRDFIFHQRWTET